MEQLKGEEYDMLDTSFKELIPKNRIFFHDSNIDDISAKLSALQTSKKNYTLHNTMPYILSQYMIIDDKGGIHFANKEQRAFLDSELSSQTELVGDRQSGKSNLIIQKALLEKLKEPTKKIAIAAPTKLQADILKHLFLQIIERSAIVIDMSEIDILTVEEIAQKQAQKLKLQPIFETLHPTLLKKEFHFADILLVDDAFLLPQTYMQYCKHIQKKSTLLFVFVPNEEKESILNRCYYGNITFLQATEFPALLKQLRLLHNTKETDDILLFYNAKEFDEVVEDIEGFSGFKVTQIDTDKELYSQNLTTLKLSVYNSKVPLHADYTLLTAPCDIDFFTLAYLAKSSRKKSYVIYEKTCENISQLQHLLENSDEEDRQK